MSFLGNSHYFHHPKLHITAPTHILGKPYLSPRHNEPNPVPRRTHPLYEWTRIYGFMALLSQKFPLFSPIIELSRKFPLFSPAQAPHHHPHTHTHYIHMPTTQPPLNQPNHKPPTKPYSTYLSNVHFCDNTFFLFSFTDKD